MKMFVLIVLLTVLALSIFYIVKDYRVRSDANRQRLAYVALISEGESKDQAVLSCKQTSLQRRDDYPEVIHGKSVEQIKQLILSQPANC